MRFLEKFFFALFFFKSCLFGMDVGYVVAHYTENIDWAKPFSSQTYVYHKGYEEGPTFPVLSWQKLPNVGREGHTYLYHIINHYDYLDDIMVFLQGCIVDHAYGKTVQGIVEEARLNGMGCFGRKYYPSFGQPYRGFFLFFQRVMKKKAPRFLNFYTNACFAVRKERILAHPKSFYENLYYMLNQENDPIEGHYLERLWLYLFDPENAIGRL